MVRLQERELAQEMQDLPITKKVKKKKEKEAQGGVIHMIIIKFIIFNVSL